MMELRVVEKILQVKNLRSQVARAAVHVMASLFEQVLSLIELPIHTNHPLKYPSPPLPKRFSDRFSIFVSNPSNAASYPNPFSPIKYNLSPLSFSVLFKSFANSNVSFLFRSWLPSKTCSASWSAAWSPTWRRSLCRWFSRPERQTGF